MQSDVVSGAAFIISRNKRTLPSLDSAPKHRACARELFHAHRQDAHVSASLSVPESGEIPHPSCRRRRALRLGPSLRALLFCLFEFSSASPHLAREEGLVLLQMTSSTPKPAVRRQLASPLPLSGAFACATAHGCFLSPATKLSLLENPGAAASAEPSCLRGLANHRLLSRGSPCFALTLDQAKGLWPAQPSTPFSRGLDTPRKP